MNLALKDTRHIQPYDITKVILVFQQVGSLRRNNRLTDHQLAMLIFKKSYICTAYYKVFPCALAYLIIQRFNQTSYRS